jgi:uncharacterized membrane protein YkoI
MQTKTSIPFGVIGVTALGASLAFAGVSNANEVHKSDPALLAQARISMEQARVIALKAHPGKITDEELEQEKGGSGLRYSFDIQKGKVTQEVGVDAKTSKVLENDPEGPNAD